ncbi:armadillo repeat-containing protein 7 isoform X1 [Piliocolobus tephrosceles]|uniref:armadillo repeat-containing protein 7 isoform X1 n=1 Tax=Piliocolobus tephrosceles TaxID=591936 RepID=UPI000C2989F2|nr:armadillo repeat-containing protein 7 isoform X1 [Piliocolobus tephrosceles]
MAQKPKVDPHVGRLGYLQALVTEFQETQSQDAKEQVLANLANFAYDPSNYEYLRQLQVLDLFLDSLSEENEALVEFAIVETEFHRLGKAGLELLTSGDPLAWPPNVLDYRCEPPRPAPCEDFDPGLIHLSMGGLCNLCPDRANKEHILQAGGVPLIINCLSSPNEETVLSAITTLMHLSPSGRSFSPELTAAPVVQCMLRFSLSASARLRNLAQIFLEDFCSPRQVAEARSRQAHSALGIPLPRSMAPRQR